MRLSEKTIRQIPLPDRLNRIHYDEEVSGFGLRITKNGARSFILNYRIDGRERRYTIGPYPEWSATAARELAKELRRRIDTGDDPLSQRQERRAEPTFAELVAEYIAVEAKRQKRRKEYERILTKDALPAWGPMRASEIRRRDVIALIEKKAEDAPIGANRLFELLRRLFNFAIRRDILETNPCQQIRKPGEERSKDRVLSAEEIKELWAGLDGPHFTKQTAAALRLILTTAQRPGEVCSMRWTDIDLDGGWWTIPAERSKNGLAHRVPLNETAKEILKGLPQVTDYVFASPRRGQHVHRNALALSLRRARDEDKHDDPLTVTDFSPHDLRRSAASHMASAGVERFLVGRILNHAEPGVTRVYDRHTYDSEKRRAAEVWDGRLRSILSEDDAGKVVAIR